MPAVDTADVESRRKIKARRMSGKLPTRQTSSVQPAEERRGSLRWVRSVLGRSIRLEQRRDQPAVTGTDPRRGAAADAPLSLLMQQRADLGARLLVHDPATQPVRNLFVIHDELASRGWEGVKALPPQIVERALAEAEILSGQESSILLSSIIESLKALRVAADERVARAAHAATERGWETLKVPEVSEANYEEYELMERSWVGTVPAGLGR
jgi:hypothetical protein